VDSVAAAGAKAEEARAAAAAERMQRRHPSLSVIEFYSIDHVQTSNELQTTSMHLLHPKEVE
jgi:ribosomal protein L15E